MGRDRTIPRRRVVSLAGAGLAALAGCTDDGTGTDDGVGDEAEDDEDDGDDETAPGGEDHDEVEDEEALPEAEGTNVLVEVVDEEDGTPVPGVVVTVTGGEFDDEVFETDPDGTVVLQDLEPDDYTFAAATEEGEDEETVSLGEGEDATVTLAVPVPESEPEGE
jgi:hypothetical protein